MIQFGFEVGELWIFKLSQWMLLCASSIIIQHGFLVKPLLFYTIKSSQTFVQNIFKPKSSTSGIMLLQAYSFSSCLLQKSESLIGDVQYCWDSDIKKILATCIMCSTIHALFGSTLVSLNSTSMFKGFYFCGGFILEYWNKE